MNITESLPGMYYQANVDRLTQIDLPSGWVRSIEPIQPYGSNLTMLLGTSGTGRDSLLDAMRTMDPRLDRIRRVTTRNYRDETDRTRILSLTRDEFYEKQTNGKIICSYLYQPNEQWYGIAIQEMDRLRKGPALLEGTTELIPLKLMLPSSRIYLVLPNDLRQMQTQLLSREGSTSEGKWRATQAIRELSCLVFRLPSLLRAKVINGIIINTPPLADSAKNALNQIEKSIVCTSIPYQLISDLQTQFERRRDI